MVELCPQEETVKIVDARSDGSRTIVALATGLGETVATADFASKGRILWLEQEGRQPWDILH